MNTHYDSEKSVPKLKYSSVGHGFLAQDDEVTEDSTFEYLKENFGLAKKSWADFKTDFEQLVKNCSENERYKVLYLARHGQGYHNLAIDIYGEPYWDEKLCFDYGDGEIVWGPDPELTDLGDQQAKDNHNEWVNQVEKGIPVPNKNAFYVSPFTRSINTMFGTWDGIVDIKPLVLEDLREDIGEHTCDKRNTRSYLENRFGDRVTIEPALTENDELYTEQGRETLLQHNIRTKRFLDHLFEIDWDSKNPELYISVTSHSGTINSFLSSINHRPFRITPGGMIPVIVKATRA